MGVSSILTCSVCVKDITAGEGSEYGDSGIDGGAAEVEHSSRRCKAMSASFSVYSTASGSIFAGSDSGSSSGGGGDRERQTGGDQGVYENFRHELDLNSRQTREFLEEAGSAASDERSSGTLSSVYPSDILLSTVQGTVRKAGILAVKNFLVHKKNKRVEPAAKRKWKQYWVSLKGEIQAMFGIAYCSYYFCTTVYCVYTVHCIPGCPPIFDQMYSIQQSALHSVFCFTMQIVLLDLLFLNSLTLLQLKNIMHLLFHIRLITPNPNTFIF